MDPRADPSLHTRSPSPPDPELIEHLGWLRRFALRLVRNEAAADDLAQDAIVAALEKTPPAGVNLRGWLAGVVRNLRAHRLREEIARRRREQSGARKERAPQSDPTTEQADTLRLLFSVLMQVREPARDVLLLRYRDGLETPEIARLLGMPAGTVRSHLSRGLAEARASLDARHGGNRRRWREGLLALAEPRAATPIATRWTRWGVAAALCIGTMTAIFVAAMRSGATSAATPEIARRNAEGATAAPAVAVADAASLGRSTAAAPREASAAAPSEAPLEGQVVDLRTREPVARFAFELAAAGGKPMLVTTGDDGRFRTPAPLPLGELVMSYPDQPANDPAHRTQLLHEHRVNEGRPARATFAARVGPTFTLEMGLPSGLRASDFVAIVRGRESLYTIHGDVGRAARIGVLDGPRPWVRFGPDVIADASVGDPWTLVVASRDGMWWGSGSVERLYGAALEPIPIALRGAGAVRGTILSANGEPVERGIVRLDWPGEATRAGYRSGTVKTKTGAGGAFELRALEPGEYLARAFSPFHEPLVVPISVVAGQVVTRDFRLARLPSAGDLAGRMRSRTGRFDLPMEVDLMRPDLPPGMKVTSAAVRWSGPPDARVGEFRFEGVTAGRYTILPRTPSPYLFDWSPRTADVEPGNTGIELELQDDVPTAAFFVEARDASTSEEIPLFDCVRTVDGRGTDYLMNAPSRLPVLEFTPLDKRFTLELRADGYVPISLDESSFVDGAAGRRVARVGLERGWGVTVFAQTGDRRPVEGAVILVDGAEAGSTDASGRLRIARPTPPRALGARYGAWVPASTPNFDATTGRYRDFLWSRVDIVLHPPKAAK